MYRLLHTFLDGRRQAKWKGRVFRLRGLPNRRDVLGSRQPAELRIVLVSDIRVVSLATTVEREKPRSKVAMLQLSSLSSVFLSTLDDDEWGFLNHAGLECLTLLDCHFLDLTPLNDMERNLHIGSIHPTVLHCLLACLLD